MSGEQRKLKYRDGVPCEHRSCINHVLTPCEVCGRKMAKGDVYDPPYIFMDLNERDIRDDADRMCGLTAFYDAENRPGAWIKKWGYHFKHLKDFRSDHFQNGIIAKLCGELIERKKK